MAAWSAKALTMVAVGAATSATGFGYFWTQQVKAEEPKRDLVHVEGDTISPIPDNPLIIDKHRKATLSLVQATRASRDLAQQILTIGGYSGMVVGVSIKGIPCWVQGFGFADVESKARCNKDTVMRIASISKPLAMAAVAKLFEEGKLDLDKSIYDYIGTAFPVKKVDGQKVDMNIKLIASHLSGIRHYVGNESDKLFKHYDKTMDAIEIFATDDLIAKPGTAFNYSTFAYSLIGAAIEAVLPKDKSFGDYLINDICRKSLGMTSTYLDENDKIIVNRAKQYIRDEKTLKNAPFVDCSYKYAGGGILSSVPDLLRFGNAMLYSFQPSSSPGFLKKSTVDMLWTPSSVGAVNFFPGPFITEACYGLGWQLIRNAEPKFVSNESGFAPPAKDIIFHTGSATGGTSLLVIVPEKELVIAIICNNKYAGLIMKLGAKIIENFSNVSLPPEEIYSNPQLISSIA